MEHVAMLVAVLLVGVMMGWSLTRAIRFAKRRKTTFEERLKDHLSKKKIHPVLDKTKRRSLQPGARLTPKGYTDPIVSVPLSPVVKPPAPEERAIKARSAIPVRHLTDNEKDQLQGHFSHKFFGSQLVVGDRIVLGGLSRALHRIEINKEGRVFVDNVPFDFNPGDAMRVKEALVKSRSN